MRLVGLLLGMAALALGSAACGTSEDRAAGAPEGPTTKTAREALVAEERDQAPDIEGETLDGERVSLADLRGMPVFVKVFAGY